MQKFDYRNNCKQKYNGSAIKWRYDYHIRSSKMCLLTPFLTLSISHLVSGSLIKIRLDVQVGREMVPGWV